MPSNPQLSDDPARRQSWSAERYEKNARFVSDLGEEILAWLDVRPGERILDLGCGDGTLSERIIGKGAELVGIDVSDELLKAACAKGLNVQHMDAAHITFENEFDGVFSNAALHWVLDPDAVISGIGRALKNKGRFVAEFGGHGNVAAIITAMRAAAKTFDGDEDLCGPWYFPTPDEYKDRLTKAGFKVRRIGLFPRPTRLPTGLTGWLQTFRKPFFDQFKGNTRGKVLTYVEDLLRPSLCDATGEWTADYVRLRVKAIRSDRGI